MFRNLLSLFEIGRLVSKLSDTSVDISSTLRHGSHLRSATHQESRLSENEHRQTIQKPQTENNKKQQSTPNGNTVALSKKAPYPTSPIANPRNPKPTPQVTTHNSKKFEVESVAEVSVASFSSRTPCFPHPPPKQN